VPLKNISTITVAESLVSIFSRAGIPQEILSDQGTQFTSNLMKEVGRLLSLKQLTTTPYHPQCNGLVERFNGTLKTMLKQMCSESPKDRDRYIDALLFAYRETPQESLRFARTRSFMPCEKLWIKKIDNMLSMGVIEPSSAAYALPVVMVKKPDGSTRVCIDYRKLNSVTVFDPGPMPTAEEIFAKLAGDRYLSKFDLSNGYWQVPVHETDRDLNTFVCHRGLFRFRVMPFELVNAPATFSRLMRLVLRDSHSLDNYLDDVLSHTPDWSRHLIILRNFFDRIRQAKLTLRPSKCEIGEWTFSFLGHILSEGILSPKQDTVAKILNAPPPRTHKQLRAFLGLANFYRKYVPNFAIVAAPLTDATRKESPNEIPWNEARDQPFQELKKRISSPPILRLPDVSQPFIFQTDASHLGVEAVLLQEDTVGEKRSIAFASRKFLPRESRYSTIEENVSQSLGVSRSSKNTSMEPSSFMRQTTSHSSISDKPNSRTDA